MSKAGRGIILLREAEIETLTAERDSARGIAARLEAENARAAELFEVRLADAWAHVAALQLVAEKAQADRDRFAGMQQAQHDTLVRVRKLHLRGDIYRGCVCCRVEFPCATVRALNGGTG